MAEIVYDPELVGKVIRSARGNDVKLRKYHMTDKDMEILKQRFKEETKKVPKHIKKLAGNKFFNPYRRGIYYAQIQALYLLGANKWHSFPVVKKKLIDYMSSYTVINTSNDCLITGWDNFISKTPRQVARRSKDENGKIQENMIFFQRLSQKHPAGLKLRQVCAAVDLKRVSKSGLPNGIFYYRLSTYKTPSDALPIRDFSKFKKDCRKFINRKFVGKIITSDQIIINGVVQ